MIYSENKKEKRNNIYPGVHGKKIDLLEQEERKRELNYFFFLFFRMLAFSNSYYNPTEKKTSTLMAHLNIRSL
jgi:hypothetical protein